jgi:hypothetical protein
MFIFETNETEVISQVDIPASDSNEAINTDVISYANVPSDVCVKLAGAAGGFDGLAIGNTPVKNTFPNAARIELDEAAVTTACNATPTVTMLFKSN